MGKDKIKKKVKKFKKYKYNRTKGQKKNRNIKK